MSETNRLALAVLISGGGTTLRNLLAVIERGELAADIRLVVSSRAKAGGLVYAAEAGIPRHIVRRRDFETPQAHSAAVLDLCRAAKVDLLVMGGYLEHLFIPLEFEGRVINIHPSLIPAFCGHGLYGRHVHEAVLAYGAKLSGCTVHFVDNEYDHGPIILQRAVSVLDDDSPETLAARVFEEECRALPDALRLYAAGRLHLQGRRVKTT